MALEGGNGMREKRAMRSDAEMAHDMELARKANAEFAAMPYPYPPLQPDANCPKCDSGSPFIATIYEPTVWPSEAHLGMWPHPERMRRSCHHCGVVWFEKPTTLDTIPPSLSTEEKKNG